MGAIRRFAAQYLNRPVMIDPAKARALVAAFGDRIGLKTGQMQTAPSPEQLAVYRQNLLARYEAIGLRSSGGGLFVASSSRLAVIPIVGTLGHRVGGFDAMSGVTDYQDIKASLREARADSAVRGVLLDVDSPGGSVEDVFDLADEIHAGRDRKPIWAVANSTAASAAYLLGSSASRLVMPRVAWAGSIGVVAVHVDESAADEIEGLAFTYVFAGAHKVDGNPHGALPKAVREDWQKEVDGLWGLFVETVARNRGLEANAVRSTEARLFTTHDAIGAGLADGISTLEQALTELAADADRPRNPGGSMNTQQPAGAATPPETVTVPPAPPAATAPAPGTMPAGGATVVDLAAARDQGADYALEVTQLCQLAGKPEAAAAFIAAKTPASTVRDSLMKQKADASTAQGIVSRAGPDAGGQAGKSIDPAGIYGRRAAAIAVAGQAGR